MIESVEQLKGILDYVGRHVSSPATAYLIGGGALMMHGLKDTTKDVDLATDPQATNYIISGLREADNSRLHRRQPIPLPKDISEFARHHGRIFRRRRIQAARRKDCHHFKTRQPHDRSSWHPQLFVLKDHQLKTLLK